jgi:hypothetical protein
VSLCRSGARARVCVRACVRACVHACVRACVCVSECACVCVCVYEGVGGDETYSFKKSATCSGRFSAMSQRLRAKPTASTRILARGATVGARPAVMALYSVCARTMWSRSNPDRAPRLIASFKIVWSIPRTSKGMSVCDDRTCEQENKMHGKQMRVNKYVKQTKSVVDKQRVWLNDTVCGKQTKSAINK